MLIKVANRTINDSCLYTEVICLNFISTTIVHETLFIGRCLFLPVIC